MADFIRNLVLRGSGGPPIVKVQPPYQPQSPPAAGLSPGQAEIQPPGELENSAPEALSQVHPSASQPALPEAAPPLPVTRIRDVSAIPAAGPRPEAAAGPGRPAPTPRAPVEADTQPRRPIAPVSREPSKPDAEPAPVPQQVEALAEAHVVPTARMPAIQPTLVDQAETPAAVGPPTAIRSSLPAAPSPGPVGPPRVEVPRPSPERASQAEARRAVEPESPPGENGQAARPYNQPAAPPSTAPPARSALEKPMPLIQPAPPALPEPGTVLENPPSFPPAVEVRIGSLEVRTSRPAAPAARAPTPRPQGFDAYARLRGWEGE